MAQRASVSTNPPLLAFAELQLYAEAPSKQRLRAVYPKLKLHFDFLVSTYRMSDRLFFSDALGSGMDNIPRYPSGWHDDGEGIRVRDLHPEIFSYNGLSAFWNRQGRSVDMSAQMALFAEDLGRIARHIGEEKDVRACCPSMRKPSGPSTSAAGTRKMDFIMISATASTFAACTSACFGR